MAHYSHRNKSDLEELYVEKKLTQEEVAEECGVSASTVSKWINRFGIETGYDTDSDEIKDKISNNYNENMSFEEMASGTGIKTGKFRYHANKMGLYEPTEQNGYTNKELISSLQNEFDETPSKRMVKNNNNLPTVTTYRDHFGTWNDAVSKSGFEPHKSRSDSTWNRDEMISDLESFSDQVDTVTVKGFCESEFGPESRSPILRIFNSFSELLSESSIPENKYTNRFKSNEYLLSKLSEVGESVSYSDIRKSDKIPNISLYKNRFGSLKQACKEAGIDLHRDSKISEEEVKSHLDTINEPIKFNDIESLPISPGTIYSVTSADNIEEAVELLGFKYKSSTYTDKELIQEMKRCKDKYGEVKVGIFKKDDSLPSWFTYVNRFGSWSNAKEISGCRPDNRGREAEYENGYETYLYGPKFISKREEVRDRAERECQSCGIDESKLERKLDVHHVEPVRTFENPCDSHTYDNLVALCHDCHMKVEANNIPCPKPPQS